jgi:hypothetical protein
MFVSCGRDSELERQVAKISTLSELGTVEYVIEKVVKLNDDKWYKIGDRKILFTCKASLKSGIDLAELSKDSIVINSSQKSIVINLPKPKLLSFNMKPDDIKFAYQKNSYLRSDFSAADREEIMVQAEKDIKENIEALGILKEAEQNAKFFLEVFLSQAGFKEININFSKKEYNEQNK